ncbi:hypothetical protein XENTR_v10003618 [Xenopus tropicalis]|nr:hypothetical protein XENTR_v10003618 [Xenopus tropicalis]
MVYIERTSYCVGSCTSSLYTSIPPKCIERVNKLQCESSCVYLLQSLAYRENMVQCFCMSSLYTVIPLCYTRTCALQPVLSEILYSNLV